VRRTGIPLAAGLFATLSAASGGETLRGVVFHDVDRNGAWQHEVDAPLRGIGVSNGRRIVETDGDGRFEIEAGNGRCVFVIKPSGWATPLDALNIPRFSYLHDPDGSPEHGYRYPVVEPTGPAPALIEFPLTPRAEPEAFRFIAISDPQPYDTEEVGFYAQDVVSELVGTDAALAIILGDLVGDDLDLFEPLNRVQALMGVPVYSVLGNHDLNFMSPNDEDSDETFVRTYGPPDYAFNYGPVHFIVLDNVVWNGFDGMNEAGTFPRTGNYVGGLSEAQLGFVRASLARVPEGRIVVLCMHIPIDGPNQHSVPQLDGLVRIVTARHRGLVLTGHMHRQSHSFYGGRSDAAPRLHHWNVGTASGSWWRGPKTERGVPVATMQDGTPNGYGIIGVDGNSFTLRYKAADYPANAQMHVHAPAEIEAGEASATTVSVNVWNGSARTRVRMRIGGLGEWIEMTAAGGPDPAYVEAFERSESMRFEGNALNKPDDAVAHLWTATLPATLSTGTHAIEVEATDMFGRTDRAVRVISVR